MPTIFRQPKAMDTFVRPVPRRKAAPKPSSQGETVLFNENSMDANTEQEPWLQNDIDEATKYLKRVIGPSMLAQAAASQSRSLTKRERSRSTTSRSKKG